MGKSKKNVKPKEKVLKVVHPLAAGIDISPKENWVCLPEHCTENHIRKFGSTTAELRAIGTWLKEHEIPTVAMESTGVYWIPLREILEEAGVEVVLVHAQHVKGVPGRKTDVRDCQWIQQMHTYGLLRGAYRPSDEILPLRTYVRERERLIRKASDSIRKMQKELDQMNVLVHRAVSDITGKTGLAIIQAIVEGERNPEKLAKHRDGRCKHSEKEIAAALDGNFLNHHIYCLKLSLEAYKFIQSQIGDLDGMIEAELLKFKPRIDLKKNPLPSSKRKKRKVKGDPHLDVRRLVYPLLGTDLSQMEGVSQRTLLTIISEIGWDMSYWQTCKRFCSWLTLCPGNNKSGGVNHSSHTRRSNNRLAKALRLAANGLHKSSGPLGNYLRRMKSKIGRAEAITATAHKIARVIYHLIKERTAYDPKLVENRNPKQRKNHFKRLRKSAAEQGFYLVSEAEMNQLLQARCA